MWSTLNQCVSGAAVGLLNCTTCPGPICSAPNTARTAAVGSGAGSSEPGTGTAYSCGYRANAARERVPVAGFAGSVAGGVTVQEQVTAIAPRSSAGAPTCGSGARTESVTCDSAPFCGPLAPSSWAGTHSPARL